MAHGADAALGGFGVSNAAEGGGYHVAVFEGRGEAVALTGVMPEPVEQLGPTPLMRVDAAAPLNGFKMLGVGELGDLLGFEQGAMVAPEVVFAEWLHGRVDGNDAGAGCVQCERFDLAAVDAGGREDLAHSDDESGHLVVVRLGGEVRVFALAVQRVAGRSGAKAAKLAIEKCDPGA